MKNKMKVLTYSKISECALGHKCREESFKNGAGWFSDNQKDKTYEKYEIKQHFLFYVAKRRLAICLPLTIFLYVPCFTNI